MSNDAEIGRIATRQHGLITRDQARDAGLGDWAVRHRLETGRWERARRGVYVIAGAPASERQAILAASLAAGPDAVVARSSAAALWGLDLPRPSEIELVGVRRRLIGVRTHQTTTLTSADVSRLGAIVLTSPSRTLVDCSGDVPTARLGAVVDDALRRGLVRLDALRACHERVDTGPGRRPTLAMRQVLAERLPGHAPGDSAREADIVRLLAKSQLPAPVLGHRVRVGRHAYKLNISWPERLVCLEFDSWEFHRTFTSFHADRQRTRRLVAAGWTLIPVTARTDLHELLGQLLPLLSWREGAA